VSPTVIQTRRGCCNAIKYGGRGENKLSTTTFAANESKSLRLLKDFLFDKYQADLNDKAGDQFCAVALLQQPTHGRLNDARRVSSNTS
jgi:hypothetical protein